MSFITIKEKIGALESKGFLGLLQERFGCTKF